MTDTNANRSTDQPPIQIPLPVMGMTQKEYQAAFAYLDTTNLLREMEELDRKRRGLTVLEVPHVPWHKRPECWALILGALGLVNGVFAQWIWPYLPMNRPRGNANADADASVLGVGVGVGVGVGGVKVRVDDDDDDDGLEGVSGWEQGRYEVDGGCRGRGGDREDGGGGEGDEGGKGHGQDGGSGGGELQIQIQGSEL